MKLTLTSTAIAALVAGSAMADGVTFADLSFDYNTYELDDVDVDITQFVGELEYKLGQVLLGAGFLSVSAEADGDSIDGREFEAFGGYFITPEVLVGLGAGTVDVDDADDTTIVEAFGQYRNDQIGAALNISQDTDTDDVTYLAVGKFAVSPAVELGAAFVSVEDVDGVGYVLSAEYDEGPFDVRAAYQGQTDVDDFSAFIVRGSYEFAGSFRGLAAFETVSLDSDIDVDTFNIGAGYRITDGAWIDVTAGQIDADGETVDTIAATISFELGDRVRLDNEFVNDELREDFNKGGRLFATTVEE